MSLNGMDIVASSLSSFISFSVLLPLNNTTIIHPRNSLRQLHPACTPTPTPPCPSSKLGISASCPTKPCVCVDSPFDKWLDRWSTNMRSAHNAMSSVASHIIAKAICFSRSQTPEARGGANQWLTLSGHFVVVAKSQRELWLRA